MANLSTAGKTLANAQFMAHSKLKSRANADIIAV
jgi:hypothetical protein